jgi:shikimate kinase
VNILVCGFMGAGKTTFVTNFEGNELGFLTYDLDHVVADHLGITHLALGEWINKNTLQKFRDVEMSVLTNLVNQRTMKVIALGGGTPTAERFSDLQNQAKLVFLDIPFETCFKRIKNDRNRPLSALGEQSLRELYQNRLQIYRKADLILSETEIKEIEGLESLVHNLSRE